VESREVNEKSPSTRREDFGREGGLTVGKGQDLKKSVSSRCLLGNVMNERGKGLARKSVCKRGIGPEGQNPTWPS